MKVSSKSAKRLKDAAAPDEPEQSKRFLKIAKADETPKSADNAFNTAAKQRRSRTEEAKLVAREYANDQKAIINKLRS